MDDEHKKQEGDSGAGVEQGAPKPEEEEAEATVPAEHQPSHEAK